MAAAKASSPLPLTLQEFGGLLEACGPFEANPALAVAVSGGSDSMSLALLAQEWAAQRGSAVTALTVDHHLRPESAQEAQQVQRWCRPLGIVHHILEWQPPSDLSALQATAREARYRLMTEFCRQHGILHLLTAHQREDQSETLFFRLARGSGLSGLACMPAVSEASGVRLLRPLLAIPKERLQAALQQRGQPWLEDPSNQKPIYTRNRIRQMLAKEADPDAIHIAVSGLTESLAQFRNLLEHKLASCIANSVFLLPEGYSSLDRQCFLALPQDLALRLLSALVMTLSGVTAVPRSAQLERLHADLFRPSPVPRRSFSGLLFIRRKNGPWLVCREPNAIQGQVDLPAGTALRWDRRFQLSSNAPGIRARAIGADGMAILRDMDDKALLKYPREIPKMVLASLPSFWHLEKMIAIPHIEFVHKAYKHYQFTARFTPVKPLAGFAFFSMNTQPNSYNS